MPRGPCGIWNRKWKPKAANGCDDGWRKSSRPKPSATAEFFPHSQRKAHHRRTEPMQLRTAFGVVVLRVWHGKDPVDGHWGCPIRERWGLGPHQQLSPALEDKLAYFGTVTVSYEAAAKLAAKVGIGVEDSTIRALVQRLGAKAEAQTQDRLGTAPVEKQPQRGATPLAVLLLDGFQVRFRGPGWGKHKTAKPRVEWHEEKLGVFYRQAQAGGKERGELLEKGGGKPGVEPPIALGSAAWRVGPRPGRAGGGRWRAVDLEHGGRPLAAGSSVAGLLPRQSTSLELGPGVASPGRSDASRMGGSAVASVAPRAGTGGVAGVGGVAASARRSRESDPAGTKLFCRPSRAHELPNAGAPRLADRQRRRGIGVPVPPRPVQGPRTVLDPHGVAPLGRLDGSPRPWSLGCTLAYRLMVVV